MPSLSSDKVSVYFMRKLLAQSFSGPSLGGLESTLKKRALVTVSTTTAVGSVTAVMVNGKHAAKELCR